MSVLRVPKDTPRAVEERLQIKLLAAEVEQKVSRGPAAEWGRRDFEYLAESILNVTGHPISVTTLRRVHSRAAFNGLPGLFTLNQLALFAGYTGWNGFRDRATGQPALPRGEPLHAPIPEPFTIAVRPAPSTKGFRAGIGVGVGLCLVGIAVSLLSLNYFSSGKPLPLISATELSGVLTAELTPEVNLPKHVRFIYKGAQLPADRLNIISFGNGNMKPINVDNHGVATTNCLYAKPGVYGVRVFSNKTTVAATPVLIVSQGWCAYTNVYDQDMPCPMGRKGGILSLDGMQALRSIHDTTPRFHTKLLNFRDFGISGDRFSLSVRFRVNACSHANADLATNIRLCGTNQNMLFQFANRPLLKGYYVQVAEYVLPANSPEQKQFKVDLSQWHNLIITNQNDTLVIDIDGLKRWSHSYKQSMGKLSGFEFSFTGSGEVDFINLKDGDMKTVYADEFD